MAHLGTPGVETWHRLMREFAVSPSGSERRRGALVERFCFTRAPESGGGQDLAQNPLEQWVWLPILARA